MLSLRRRAVSADLGAAQAPAPRARTSNKTPLIDERAATRRRIAPEGGDEHAGVKRRDQLFVISARVPPKTEVSRPYFLAPFAPGAELGRELREGAIVPIRNRLCVESGLLLDKGDVYDSKIKYDNEGCGD